MKLLAKISLLSVVLLFAFACKKDKGSSAVGVAESETKTAASKVATSSGTGYMVLPQRSTISWTGSKLAGKHMGTLTVVDGEVFMDAGKLTGGTFEIDMNSLTCTDLEAGSGKEKLEGHLKSADFFDVGTYPKANFKITKVTEYSGDAKANALVYGDLTIKDVTKSVGFKAQVNDKGNGVTVSTPEFNINRTDFGIKYGSSSFMDVVKDKAIDDNMTLSIVLGATNN